MIITKSKIKTYDQIPRLFKYIHIDKLKPDTPKHFVTNRGLILHDLFKKFFDYVSYENVEGNIFNYFCSAMEVDEKYRLDLNRFCKNEEILYRLKQKPIYLEYEIGYDNLFGIIDRINFDGTNYSIIDYKSNVKDIDSYLFELYFYKHIIDLSGLFDKPIKYVGIYGYNDTKLFFEPTKQELSDLMLKKLNSFSDIDFKNIDFDAIKGRHCSYCEYKLTCNKEKDQKRLTNFIA